MKKYLVLNSQKNELYKVTVDIGLNPSDFEWVERESLMTENALVSSLVHRPTGYYFLFDFHREKHWMERSPGADSYIDHAYPGSWNYQRSYAFYVS